MKQRFVWGPFIVFACPCQKFFKGQFLRKQSSAKQDECAEEVKELVTKTVVCLILKIGDS